MLAKSIKFELKNHNGNCTKLLKEDIFKFAPFVRESVNFKDINIQTDMFSFMKSNLIGTNRLHFSLGKTYDEKFIDDVFLTEDKYLENIVCLDAFCDINCTVKDNQCSNNYLSGFIPFKTFIRQNLDVDQYVQNRIKQQSLGRVLLKADSRQELNQSYLFNYPKKRSIVKIIALTRRKPKGFLCQYNEKDTNKTVQQCINTNFPEINLISQLAKIPNDDQFPEFNVIYNNTFNQLRKIIWNVYGNKIDLYVYKQYKDYILYYNEIYSNIAQQLSFGIINYEQIDPYQQLDDELNEIFGEDSNIIKPFNVNYNNLLEYKTPKEINNLMSKMIIFFYKHFVYIKHQSNQINKFRILNDYKKSLYGSNQDSYELLMNYQILRFIQFLLGGGLLYLLIQLTVSRNLAGSISWLKTKKNYIKQYSSSEKRNQISQMKKVTENQKESDMYKLIKKQCDYDDSLLKQILLTFYIIKNLTDLNIYNLEFIKFLEIEIENLEKVYDIDKQTPKYLEHIEELLSSILEEYMFIENAQDNKKVKELLILYIKLKQQQLNKLYKQGTEQIIEQYQDKQLIQLLENEYFNYNNLKQYLDNKELESLSQQDINEFVNDCNRLKAFLQDHLIEELSDLDIPNNELEIINGCILIFPINLEDKNDELIKLFEEWSNDKDGQLTLEEAHEGMKVDYNLILTVNIHPIIRLSFQAAKKHYAKHNDTYLIRCEKNQIEFCHFEYFFLQFKKYIDQYKIFKKLDIDGSKSITKTEQNNNKDIIKEQLDIDNTNKAYLEMSNNNDKVTFKNFINQINKQFEH